MMFQKVLKETTEVLIRIEPKEVTIRQAKEQVYTEKFLFFFFPRKSDLSCRTSCRSGNPSHCSRRS